MRFLFGKSREKFKRKVIDRDVVRAVIINYITPVDGSTAISPEAAASGALEILEGLGLIEIENVEESA